MLRILTALTAMVTAVLLGLTIAPAAHAESWQRPAASDRATDTDNERQAKPRHVIRRFVADEIRNTGRFFVRGKAITYKGKIVQLQRANRQRGPWRTVKGDRASRRNGYFRITFDGPIGTHFRLVLRETRNYRLTKVYIGSICREPC